MSLLDTASLIVTPNAYKEGKLYSVIPSDGSGDMSVVRATTATRVNSAGLVELVPYNYKVQSENLTLGVGLDDSTITTITANTNETLDPFGGNKAEKYNGSTGQYADTYNFIPQNSVVTSSLYVKAGTATSFTLRLNASFGTFAFATFNLTNGTVTTTGTDGYAYISSAINSVGNGWYRCSLTYNFISIPTNRILLAENGSIYVFGWQLVEGSVAKDYQKTETRLNIPRLDYSNGTCPSLLVEPQRTNLLTYSSSFDNAAWVKSNATISANTIASPSGIQDADSIIENTATGIHIFYQGPIAASSGIYTTSMFFKKNTRQYAFLQIAVNGAADRFTAVIDLNNGNVTDTTTVGSPTSTSYTTEDFGNGWYRLTVSAQHNSGNVFLVSGLSDSATPTYNVTGEPNYTGNGTGSVYAWGAQAELGSYSTSYIPTTSASVTRNADNIELLNSTILPTSYPFTMFLDAKYSSLLSFFPLSFLNSASSSNYYALFFESGKVKSTIRPNSTEIVLVSTNSYSESQSVRVAVKVESASIKLFVNGQLEATAANTLLFNAAINDLFIGKLRSVGDTNTRLGLNSAAIWATALTDAECQTLTTI